MDLRPLLLATAKANPYKNVKFTLRVEGTPTEEYKFSAFSYDNIMRIFGPQGYLRDHPNIIVTWVENLSGVPEDM